MSEKSSRLTTAGKWALGVFGAGVIFTAQTKPEDATSNIAAWLHWIGIDKVPNVFASTSVDTWGTVAGTLSLLYTAWWMLRAEQKERIIRTVRNIFHKELQAETRPTASLGVEFIPASPIAPCWPISIVGLMEATDTPNDGWTALRVVVRNDSDQNLAGLAARLVRADPELGSLHGPMNLPLVLATKDRLDRLRNPAIHEQIPMQGFDLHAHSEKAVEVVWLHAEGALEGYITHEAGEADFLFMGSQELYVEVTGAGHPIVAGVRINVADDDIQSWTAELIIEAAGEAHGNSGVN